MNIYRPEKFKTLSKAYNIDVECLRYLPANVYWKNLDGVYLGCNEKMAEELKLSSEKDFVGTTLSDYAHLLDIASLEQNDKTVIHSGNSLCVVEGGFLDNVDNYLSTKLPLKNQDGEIVGLIGISFNMNKLARMNDFSYAIFNENMILHSDYATQISDAFYKNLSAQGIRLTIREKECLRLLSQGHAMKAIGQYLKISSRTVETHIYSIKRKLNCATKAQLLDKVRAIYVIDRVKSA